MTYGVIFCGLIWLMFVAAVILSSPASHGTKFIAGAVLVAAAPILVLLIRRVLTKTK